jgi:hypothetical protein
VRAGGCDKEMAGCQRVRLFCRLAAVKVFAHLRGIEGGASEVHVAIANAQFKVTAQVPGRQSGQPEARNQLPGIAGQGLEQVPALLSRG